MICQQSTVLVMLVTIAFSSAHIGGGQLTLQDINPQVYCGRALSKALAIVCFDRRDPDESKRAESGTMYGALLAPYYKEQESQQLDWPWLAPHKARGLSLPSRGKRFVVNECCDKACSISELLSYCPMY